MILHADKESFKELIELASNHFGYEQSHVEKDYWVCKILKEISESEFRDKTYFKGGTSLSKAYGLIQRFSEDLDLFVFTGDITASKSAEKTLNFKCKVQLIYYHYKHKNMKLNNVRLLVKDFSKCFNFYKEQLGLEVAWGDENSGYASFKVAEGIEGLALFQSDWMAPSVGNEDKQLPVGYREKSLISFCVDNVDETYTALKAKGVAFINEPTDMTTWGMRTVHFRDPEENLIELYTPRAA